MIDLNILKTCDYTPWMHEDNGFLEQLKYFDNSVIDNHDKMHNLIEGLEILKNKLDGWMFINKSTLDENDIRYLMNMLSKHIDVLKKNEGIHFELCRRSVNVSLRLVQFLLCSLYDYTDIIIGVKRLPDEIRDLI